MLWIQSILDIYWEMRPCKETQELYKSNGLTTFEYWRMEIEYLTQSTWIKDDEFQGLEGVQYLLEKYPGEIVILDEIDQFELRNRFLIDLGIHPAFFVHDIPILIYPPFSQK